VCGWKSKTLLPLVRKFAKHLEQEYLLSHSSPLYDEEHVERIDSVTLPVSCTSIAQLPSYHRAVKYIKLRGLSERDVWRWRLMWISDGEFRDRVLFPSFSSDGSLSFWVARVAGEWRPKYVNPNIPANDIIFGEIDVDFRGDIIICEGPFDAVKCGDRAVPLLGSSLDESHALFDTIVKNDSVVTLMLDSDAQRKALKIASLLSSYDVTVKIARSSPDPGAMTHQECQDAVNNATLFTWESMLKSKMEIALT